MKVEEYIITLDTDSLITQTFIIEGRREGETNTAHRLRVLEMALETAGWSGPYKCKGDEDE